MNAEHVRLQEAISEIRRTHGPLKTWVLLRCANPACPVEENNVYVSEQPNVKPFQAAGAMCWRCKEPLHFEGFEQ